MEPLYVRVHAADNVAIIVNSDGVRAGARFRDDLIAAEAIPQSHKISLRPIATGEPVVRYGQLIGYATRDLPAGSWIREDSLTLPSAPSLAELSLLVTPPAPEPPLSGYGFEGYRNANGSAGTKNILGITTTVQCVAPTVDYAVRRIKAEILPRYPNVDDVVALTHTYGCGVAIDAPGAAIPILSIRNLALHPNFGADPLVVSLGCEKMQPVRLGMANDEVIRLQENLGFAATVARLCEAAERRLEVLNRRHRVPCDAADLVVGLQCGGSDAFSGVTCNPAVGFAADLLVRAGATVMFSEVTEVRDAIHLLTPRCATPDVARDLIREMQWYDDYLAGGRADRSANPTPGNKRGGLSNVVEKALGSVAKSGTSALRQVTSHGQRPTERGLIFAATPASDFICGTQQLAAHMNMHVFTTGEGTPYGLAMASVIKVSSRTALAEKWPDLIDLDAGRIALGQETIESVGWELFHLIRDVASGRKKTWADHWGLHNSLVPFNPGPVT